MLIKENEAVADVRQTVALVAAHELAHQWFGNLVTPAWWSDLWLKEGFASFFGNLAVDNASIRCSKSLSGVGKLEFKPGTLISR